MGDYGWDKDFADWGYGFPCGSVLAAKDAAECLEEHEVVEL